jgi:hypothetical protein
MSMIGLKRFAEVESVVVSHLSRSQREQRNAESDDIGQFEGEQHPLTGQLQSSIGMHQ